MSIQPFDFRGHEVRVIVADDGEPRWIAGDVAKVLDYRETRDMTRNLDPDEAAPQIVRVRSGNGVEQDREMTVITESGLYSAILRSRKPEAREFKRWVTREVLPAIRKHGAYMTEHTIEQVLTDPDTIIKLATDLKQERARRAEIEAEAKKLEAPARSWNTMASAGGDYGVAAAAKTLSRDPNIKIGRDQLFKFMAEAGWIFRTKGKRAHWEGYQDKAIDTGRLAHKLSRPFLNEKTGEFEQPAPTIRITPKGLHELHVMLGGAERI